MPTRRAARRDANEPEIVEALETAGAAVERLNCSTGGVLDLLVGFRGMLYLLEVKTDQGRLNAAQRAFLKKFKGTPCFVVRNVYDALQAIGAIDGQD